MISKECFVYLQLPQSLEVVPCARFVREPTRGGACVGRLVYGRSFLGRYHAVALDPFQLPLSPREYRTAKLNGMFGVLRDAAPDAWGRRVIEHRLGHQDLDEFDYLMAAGDDRAGALSFGPTAVPPRRPAIYRSVMQLAELRKAAAAVEEERYENQLPQYVAELLAPGSSMGGARPKAVVEDDAGLWIAKFPTRGDRWNNAPVEAAMLELAAHCGMRVPETRIERIGVESILLVRRFDRARVSGGYHRHRMVSALTVLDAEESAVDRRNWSYVSLADEVQRWSAAPVRDKHELFRRVVFSALISNTDDHPRNHSLIAPGKDWTLAPAYDLTPNPMHSVERRDLALTCGRFGRVARRDNILSQAARFGLSPEDANDVIDGMKRLVGAEWRKAVRAAGGSDRDVTAIERAFAYEGFEYPSRG
ncbi:MAG: type II toxin-antitoxin system HipA family toxin [Gemmatimonadales bacterium]